MKPFLLACAALFFVTFCPAQNLTGIFAGAQATTSHYLINEVKQPTKFKYGFQAGMLMKVPFDKNLYFVPQIFYSLKGYTVKYNTGSYPPGPEATDNDVMLHTVELAALLQTDLGNGPTHGFLRFGPTLDFQLFGHEKFNKTGSPSSVSRPMKFGYGDYGHYGANALAQAGIETKSGYGFSLNYTFGLTNINNADGGPQITHRCIGFTISKFFHPGKIVIDTRNKE